MPENLKASRKREYNSTLKKLQQHASHLALLLSAEQQQLSTSQDIQLLLAEAILQHKVMYQFFKPLQEVQLQHEEQLSAQSSLQHTQHNEALDPRWTELVKLLPSNPMLLHAFKATPEQVKVATSFRIENARALHKSIVDRLVLLQELLCIERYPKELISADSSPKAAVLEDSNMLTLAPDLNQAATEMLSSLQSYRQLVEETTHACMLLMLHSKDMLVDLATINFMTGERANLPSNHYLQAARRLRLTSRQVQHFQLMLKQFNRMARQQNLAGQQLLAVSESSFSLQASLSGALSGSQPSSSGEPADSHLAASSQHSEHAARQQAGASKQGQSEPGVPSEGVAEAGQSADSQTAGLEELLARHMFDRLDLMGVIGLWVFNTLSPWQLGEFVVASFPYYSYLPAIVEVSAFLQPCDEPRAHINAGCCEAAAQAAALADELGYLDAHGFMRRRCEALAAQLQWVQKEALKDQRL